MPPLDRKPSKRPVPEDISTQYDKVGPEYIELRMQQSRAGTERPSVAFIDRHLTEKAGHTLLDVGCLNGQDVQRYQRYGFSGVRGVDPSPKMVEAAHQLLGIDAPVGLGRWEDLPFLAGSFDYLVGKSSLHYSEDLSLAYAEAARVLKQRGKLIAVVPHPERATNIIMKDDREYVQETIFRGQIPITYPRHHLAEYFSPIFKQLFILEAQEKFEASNWQGDNEDQLAFVARKR